MKTGMILCAAFVLLGGSVYFYTRPGNQGQGRDRTFQTVEARRGAIEVVVEATGVVQPLNRVEIKPPIPGRIERLAAEEGDAVKAGQILGWMSSTDRAAILDAARAKGLKELKRWESAYKPTPIMAPLSGTIILRNVVVGQTVDPGTVIAAMSDKLIVKASIDETDIGRVRMNMLARITLDSFPGEPIEGKVMQILHEGVNVSNVITYPVKIEPETIPPFFRSQMTANIRLIADKKEGVILLPVTAVNRAAGGGHTVLVAGSNGKPRPKPVHVGLENNESIEIVEGLNEGESVLIASRRYVPQQAPTASPLVPQRPPAASQNGKSQGGRRRSSAQP